MGKGKIILFLGVGVVAVIAIAFFVVPMLSAGAVTGNMDIRFYDEDGNLVPDPPMSPAFYNPSGNQIYSFDIDVSYTVTIEGDLQDDTLVVSGSLGIYVDGDLVQDYSFSSAKAEDSYTTPTLPIGTILAGAGVTLQDGQTYTIEVKIGIVAKGNDANSGNAVQSSPWQDSDTITVTYQDAVLQVSGYINFG